MPEGNYNFECDECGEKFDCTKKNTKLHYFPDDDGMSFMELSCPDKHITRAIVTNEWAEKIRVEGWPYKIYYAGGDQVPDDAPEVKVYDLTPRLEKLMDVLRWELENSSVEDFINTPTDNKIPKKWI